MNNRPFILTGNIYLSNKEYIIGKVIKNRNVEDKEKCVQILDNDHTNLFQDGYAGYIFESEPQNVKLNNKNLGYNIHYFETLIDYDVIEIDKNYIRVLYRDDSEDNAILVTNQCNSNCIMCPDPDEIRKTNENADVDKLLQLIKCIPDDTNHLTITGGEPGMLKDDLFLVLNECKKYLNETEFLLLSNGRILSNINYTHKLKESIPENIRVAIPLYADNPTLHDKITRAKGSFDQSIEGIRNLLDNEIDVEIRIVVTKMNYKYLNDISTFIVNKFPNVKMVNIMALEMTGNALLNKEKTWIDFDEFKEELYKACLTIIKNGIIANLYNFPLCQIDERLYSIAHKSISDYKIKFKDECNKCNAKNNCGGFFSSTVNVEKIQVHPL